MRNYIILNGKSSADVQGLLIQSLAPITKPLQRTQQETIDGRDGDIVTPLGFSAYDKTISIGLYGDYDVDDVIEYFNSAGDVTFSNEPDKYYKYQILEQIDFERLIRFKSASVTLHVQPFKYSNDEATKNYTPSGVTDMSFNIVNAGNYYAKPALTVYGTGTVNISLNGTEILVINLGETANNITIDAEMLEAYTGTTATLANRQVDGDYENLTLKIGTNVVSWTGNVTKLTIANYSRWI